MLISCSAKSSSPNKNTKDSRNQRSIDQMNKAMNELNSSSTYSQQGNSTNGNYDKTLNEADKAHNELECAVDGKGVCITTPDQSVQEKKRPAASDGSDTTVQEKSRPTAAREGSAPTGKTRYQIVNGYPIWFHQPGYDGFIGGVGIAPKQKSGDRTAQRRVAINLAYADITRSIKVNINNELTSEKLLVDTKTQNYYKEKFSSMSRQQADEYISNPQIMDEWTDEKTGELYIWAVLPK